MFRFNVIIRVAVFLIESNSSKIPHIYTRTEKNNSHIESPLDRHMR